MLILAPVACPSHGTCSAGLAATGVSGSLLSCPVSSNVSGVVARVIAPVSVGHPVGEVSEMTSGNSKFHCPLTVSGASASVAATGSAWYR